MNETRSVTPWWEDKTVKMLLVFLLGLVANAVGRKWGVSLNVEEIASMAVLVLGFTFGHKWKSKAILEAEIKADAVKRETVAAASASPAAAAAALNSVP